MNGRTPHPTHDAEPIPHRAWSVEKASAVPERQPSRLPLLPGLCVTLCMLGLAVRWMLLDQMLWDVDEGVASIYALQLVERADWPLFGVRTSLGFYNTPLFIYLVAPAFAISRSPLVATAMLQIVNLIAVAALGFACYKRQLMWVAAAVVLFGSLSPGPLLLASRLWGHTLIAAFSITTWLFLVSLHQRPRAFWASLLLPSIISFAQQVHFSGALLGLNALLVIMLLQLKPNWKAVVLGAVAAAATYTPFIIYEYRTGFEDFRAILRTVGGTGSSTRDPVPMLQAALFSLSDFGGVTAFQNDYPGFLRYELPWYRIVRWWLAALFVAAVILGVWALHKHRNDEEAPPVERVYLTLALTWCAVPLIAFSLLRVVTVPAYWLVALPGPWVLTGILLEKQRKPWWNSTAIGVTALCFFLFLTEYRDTVGQGEVAYQHYPTYRQQLDAVNYVLEDSKPDRANLLEPQAGENRIGYQTLYLVAMLEGNALRVRPDASEAQHLRKYLLINRKRPLTAAAGWSVQTFGLREVHREPGTF